MLLVVGCGGKSHPPGDGDSDAGVDGDADPGCVDLDGDGAGVGAGCPLQDCDDTDPGTTTECGDDCAARPFRAGCPCADIDVVPCYMGPAGTGGVGTCVPGLKVCTAGRWGACDGQSFPAAGETCDGRDEDCNGVVDDGVQSACGDCNFTCTETCVGVGCEAPFVADAGRNLDLNPDGSLSLGGVISPQNLVIWIANSEQGTVSKIDTRTRRELGRYRTAWGLYPDPSRTTVNPHGDVVVANRQHDSATKILASDCPDRNHDGVIQTSTGTDDVLAWSDRDQWEDECIVWNVDGIRAARGSAFEVRAELDGGLREVVWVGSYPFANGTVYEIDSVLGEKTGRELPETGAYGLAMGPGGILWSVALSGCPVATDTTTLEQTSYPCPPEGGGAYGLAVDSEGRVWIGNATARLVPATGTWELPAAQVYGSGITVDDRGNAYTGEGQGGFRIDGETMEVTPLPGMNGHGWAVDFDGDVWAVDLQANSAHVMDPDTLEVTDVTPPFAYPYTYSDMTGVMLMNTIAPAGIYEHVLELGRCDEGSFLDALAYDADLPAGGSLTLRLRSADTADLLVGEEWIAIGSAPADPSPIELDPRIAVGGVVAIEVTFATTEPAAKPTLARFALRTICGQ